MRPNRRLLETITHRRGRAIGVARFESAKPSVRVACGDRKKTDCVMMFLYFKIAEFRLLIFCPVGAVGQRVVLILVGIQSESYASAQNSFGVLWSSK
jgi:hypothetical protein